MAGLSLFNPCPCCGKTSSLSMIKLSELLPDDGTVPEIVKEDMDKYFLIICSISSNGCGHCGPRDEHADGCIKKWNERSGKPILRISDEDKTMSSLWT